RWNNQGKISSIRTSGGKRLYSVTDLEKIFQEKVNEKKKICYARNDTKILVLGSDVNVDDTESGEFVKDLLSIITIFTTRHNGLRSAQNRKQQREIKNSKDTNVPNIGRKRKIKKMDGNCEHYLNDKYFANEELSWVKETPKE
ncbi:8030_t:CDS:2, partial [Racocetra persica]